MQGFRLQPYGSSQRLEYILPKLAVELGSEEGSPTPHTKIKKDAERERETDFVDKLICYLKFLEVQIEIKTLFLNLI